MRIFKRRKPKPFINPMTVIQWAELEERKTLEKKSNEEKIIKKTGCCRP